MSGHRTISDVKTYKVTPEVLARAVRDFYERWPRVFRLSSGQRRYIQQEAVPSDSAEEKTA